MQKRLVSIILAVAMLMSFCSFAAVAADETEYKPGNVIEPATAENLNGEYGAAYAAAKYQITYTYIEEGEKELDHVEMWGDFQWFSPESVAEFEEKSLKDDYNRKDPSSYVTGYSAYQYEEGYIATGYGAPLPRVNAEDNANGEIYGKAGLYSTPGDAGYIFYPLEEVEEGVWQLTMPIPAGQYRYAYKLFYTDGTTKQIQDPAEDVDWYVLETMFENPAHWSYILVGTADEAAQGQSIIYPSVADEYKGTVVKDEIESVNTEALGGTKQKIQVYLPYDYDETRTDYKLIIVSHGNTENETVYMTFGSVPTIMDNLIADGTISTDAIVVTVDNALTLGGPGTRFATNLAPSNYVEKLIPYMVENYGASGNPDDIALCGSSAGGRATLNTMLNYTDSIGYYGIFSAPVNSTTASDEKWAELVELYANGRIYIGGGNMEWKETNQTYHLYLQFVDMGMTELEYDFVEGAHDFITWHQTFAHFVETLGWDDGVTADKVIADAVAENTVDVAVTYDGEEELTSVRMTIDCDLEVVEISSQYSYEYNPANGKIVVYAPSGTVLTGDLFTITYAIAGAADGQYPIDLTLIEATADEELIAVAVNDGAITIYNTLIIGDVNCDGIVSNADIIMIARYLVDLETLTNKQLEAADINGDGTIGNIDLVKLARSLVA